MDQKTQAPYCSSCKNIFDSARSLGQTYIHHQNGESLEQSASNGCQFCDFLWGMLTDTDRERMRRHEERPITTALIPAKKIRSDPSTYYSITAVPDGYDMEYTFQRERYDDDKYVIVKKVAFVRTKLMEHLVPEKGAVLATDVPSSVAVASRWIDICKTSHGEDCNGSNGSNGKQIFLPTRLIDVGDGNNVNPRLHITDCYSEPHEDQKYMTLSHCWGSIKAKQLMKHDLEAMKECIEFSTLPKTFQDAIQITRGLGIRYIWIDSLCIIQDCQSDWFKESSLMGDIYTNSYCNIAATAAKDDSIGCIYERDNIFASPLSVQTTWNEGAPMTYCLVDCTMWSREVDEAPLNQRAWVFQERFLSPRNLSFGAKRLFWECTEKRACETFPEALPSQVTSAAFKVSAPAVLNKIYTSSQKKVYDKKGDEVDFTAMKVVLLAVTGAQINRPLAGNFADGEKGLPNAYRQWVTIVTHYSRGLLTEESDCLIALHGVAQKMKQVLLRDDEYIAGHWKKYLLNQLLWMTYPNLKKRRPDEYRAPSWSWASVIGKVSFRDILEAEAQEKEKTARVVDVKVDTVKGKEGQVTGGSLKIFSKVLEATWTSWNRHEPFLDMRTEHEEYEKLWDNGEAVNRTPNFSFKAYCADIRITGFPDVEPDGFQNGKTLCVAIQTHSRQKMKDGEKIWSRIVEGLVLKEVGNGLFQRIGCFVADRNGAEHFLKTSIQKEVEII